MSASQSRIRSAFDAALAASLPDLQNIDYDAALTSDMGLDSVQIMDLMMEIEDRLDISIPIELLAETQTLNQLAEHLEPLLNQS